MKKKSYTGFHYMQTYSEDIITTLYIRIQLWEGQTLVYKIIDRIIDDKG